MTPLIHRLARPIFIFIWASLLFLIATNIQVGWLYVIIAFFLVIVAVSFYYPSRLARRVAVALETPALLERASPTAVAVEAGNTGPFPVFLATVVFGAENFAFDPPTVTFLHIPRRGVVRTTVKLTPLKRGVFRSAPAVVRCGAPIALFYAERKISPPVEIIVHPRLIPEPETERELEARGLGPLQRDAHRFLTDPFFHQLREGTQAESMSDLHWKLTAKRNAPVIKIRERRRAGAFTIVVVDVADHYDSNPDAFERTLETALSAAKKFVDEEIPVVIRGIIAPPVSVETAGEWEHALRWSARLELSAAADPARFLSDGLLAAENTILFDGVSRSVQAG